MAIVDDDVFFPTDCKWIVMAMFTCMNYWLCLDVLQLKSAILTYNLNYFIMLVITIILFRRYIYEK